MKGLELSSAVFRGVDGTPLVAPTIFSDVKRDMRIAQEEIFGPVLVVLPYKDVDDAVSIANDSIYGLAGGFSDRKARANKWPAA